jgi:hypothetical protein
MLEENFQKMDYSIDANIQWRINRFNSKIKQKLDEKYNLNKQLLRVLYNIPINIKEVIVRQHIFVISNTSNCLICNGS